MTNSKKATEKGQDLTFKQISDDCEQRNRRISRNAWIFTWVWLTIYTILTTTVLCVNGELESINIGVLGDSLNGLAAPIMICWVIAAYSQQRVDLGLNTQAIGLQIKELNHQVEASTELASTARDQLEYERNLIQPIIQFSSGYAAPAKGVDGAYCVASFNLRKGAIAALHLEAQDGYIAESAATRVNSGDGFKVSIKCVHGSAKTVTQFRGVKFSISITRDDAVVTDPETYQIEVIEVPGNPTANLEVKRVDS